jgi:hypothetical protein
MRACVVEIRRHLAAVLTNEGCIIKVKNKNYAIGQVIELKERAIHFSIKTAAVAASIAIVMLLGSVTAWAYYTPYTYVSLDVNPSIEYSVNRFDRVLSVQAVNNDGADILSDLDLNNKTIDEAIRDTVEQIQSDGYFKDSGGIVISTSGDDEQAAQDLADDLKEVAQEAVEDSDVPVEVEAISVGRARVLEAQKLGTTPGKLNLVQKLQASTGEENIDLQEWLNKPVKDIMGAIKAAKKQSKSEDSSSSDTESSPSSESSASSTVETSSSKAELSQEISSEAKGNAEKQAQKSVPHVKKAQADVSSGSTSSKSHGASSKANSNASSDKKAKKNETSSSDTSSGETSSVLSSGESTMSDEDSSADSQVNGNSGTSAQDKGSKGNSDTPAQDKGSKGNSDTSAQNKGSKGSSDTSNKNHSSKEHSNSGKSNSGKGNGKNK